ncbi:DUF3313 family protein [Gluconacetobacter asukensis]|uniref:DUF3313 family protein n=1 Tax=Gluconacetobacter asukensis TaxID=1017181 RepID=A0A7W4IX54_9PROT|nr:DUF3313 family protein [Gluconacetobacter asukensis]MBB2170659.1 DUF3313 family protein [Gluconacetobacter asukensis]
MISTSFREAGTRRVRRAATPLIACAAIASLAGCAGQKLTRTGFIPPETYAQMSHTKDHTDDLIYVDPNMDVARYHTVMIEPVVWQPVAKAPKLSPKAEARMTAAFQKELGEALGHDFRVLPVGDCGACTDVIRVRAAITNIRRSKWYYNAIPVVAGFAAGAAGGGMPPVPPPAPGGASEELVASDAATGEALVAVATYNNGMPWNALGQWLPYAHARRAFHLASLLLDEQFRKEKKKEQAAQAVASSAN